MASISLWVNVGGIHQNCRSKDDITIIKLFRVVISSCRLLLTLIDARRRILSWPPMTIRLLGKHLSHKRHTGACAFRDDHFFLYDLNCKKHSVFPYVFYVPNMSNVMKDVFGADSRNFTKTPVTKYSYSLLLRSTWNVLFTTLRPNYTNKCVSNNC